jgi:uncharacterized protein YxjI
MTAATILLTKLPTSGDPMPLPPPTAGWSRLLVKSRFGAGRDFIVSDPETGAQRYFVNGKLGPRPKAEITASGQGVQYRVRGSLLGIPKRMIISDASGAEVATLKARMFSPIRSRMTLEMASGEPWILEGALMEKNYAVSSAGRPIVQISQKWMTIKDTYTLDVADGIDPGLALAVLWSVDRWVERD